MLEGYEEREKIKEQNDKTDLRIGHILAYIASFKFPKKKNFTAKKFAPKWSQKVQSEKKSKFENRKKLSQLEKEL